MRLTEAMIENGTAVQYMQWRRRGRSGSRDQRETIRAVRQMLTQ